MRIVPIVMASMIGLVTAIQSPLQAQDPVDHPSLGLATYQVGSPVGLRGYLASVGSFLYQSARVENLSPSPLAAVTFGVLITNADRSHVTMMTSVAEGLALQPGRVADVDVRLLPFEQLDRLRLSLRPEQRSSLTVTLGVVAVKWSDGSRWEVKLHDDARDFSRGAGVVTPAARP